MTTPAKTYFCVFFLSILLVWTSTLRASDETENSIGTTSLMPTGQWFVPIIRLGYDLWEILKKDEDNFRRAETIMKTNYKEGKPFSEALNKLKIEGLEGYAVREAGVPSPRNLVYRKLERYLSSQRWECIRSTGSHRIFRSPSGASVVVPFHGKGTPFATGTANSILKVIEEVGTK